MGGKQDMFNEQWPRRVNSTCQKEKFSYIMSLVRWPAIIFWN